MIKHSILIPSYDEFENLKILVPQIIDTISPYIDSFEIILIDREEKDIDTYNLAMKYDIRHIQREGGDRYGDAVRSGISKARGRTIIFMDADGSHNPNEILNLCKFSDSFDLVVSSRYLIKSKSENSFFKELGSKFLNKLCKSLFKIECTDFSNSFKAYNADILKRVNLYSKDIDIIEEIIFKMIKIKGDLSIHEFPGDFRKRVNYESRRKPLIYFLSYIRTLFRLKFFNK